MQSCSFFRLLGLLLAVGSFSIARADAVGSGQLTVAGGFTITTTSMSFTGNSATVATTGNTGPFAGLSGTSVSIENITMSSPSVSPWVTTTNGITFNLTSLDLGSGTAGACLSNSLGNVCSPAGSPFTIVETGMDQSTLSFVAEGNAYTGLLSGGSSPFTARFTSQFNESITTLLGEIASSSGQPGNYSATFNVTAPATATPEPGTLISSMTGLLLVGWRVAERKRWTRRNN